MEDIVTCHCNPTFVERSASPWTCPHGNTWRLGVPGDPYCWTPVAAESMPLELGDDFGGRAQVMHGSVCVGLVIYDKPGLVLSPEQARMLAAMLTRQADHAEAAYA